MQRQHHAATEAGPVHIIEEPRCLAADRLPDRMFPDQRSGFSQAVLNCWINRGKILYIVMVEPCFWQRREADQPPLVRRSIAGHVSVVAPDHAIVAQPLATKAPSILRIPTVVQVVDKASKRESYRHFIPPAAPP